MQILDYLLHLDKYLNQWAGDLGPWLYAVVFLVIFCETGLVVTPFLPGDSLLFILGALCGKPESPLDLVLLLVLLWIAAVLGDAANYSIGYRIGPKVFSSDSSRIFNRKHLVRTQEFYEKYGGKTIVLARFVPIVRTFAPFVAGVGKMRYRDFGLYNITGGLAWVAVFLVGGYFFGEAPIVRDYFLLVIAAIIVISVLPVFVEIYRARKENRRSAAAGGTFPIASPAPPRDAT